MILEEMNKEIERNKKFTEEFDAEFAKTNIIIAPCNIWGYIQDLEKRISELENKGV